MTTMTDEQTDTVRNIVLDDGRHGHEYRNGRGKIIRTGDFIKVDNKAAMYRVVEIRVENLAVFITAYGGVSGKLSTRTFAVGRCHRVLKGEDNNEGHREAVAEMSRAVQSKRRGWN